MKGIGTYAVYKPEFAIGNGVFFKKPEAQRYRTEAQKDRIIQRNRRYLEIHRAKLKLFHLYDHPGNTLILRWPALPEQANSLNLWVCYKPEARLLTDLSCTVEGIRTITKYYLSTDQDKRKQLFELLANLAACEISFGRLWIARIYEQPGNEQLFSWSEDQGEIFPGGLLRGIDVKMEMDDLLRELEHNR